MTCEPAKGKKSVVTVGVMYLTANSHRLPHSVMVTSSLSTTDVITLGGGFPRSKMSLHLFTVLVSPK